MCGILVGKKLSENQIHSISHRGIEYSIKENNGITMCHHRLPIQTVDGDSWSQPIEIGENKYMLFNGEIFNYPSEYDSDTEYLKMLFSRFHFQGGLPMFDAIFKPHICSWDGFWAIVLVDAEKGDIYAFTDPLGKKVLYKNLEGSVCSEIKGLLNEEDPMNWAFISGVLKNGYLATDETPFQNVFKLPNNTFIHWNLNNPLYITKSAPYYDFNHFNIEFNTYEDKLDWLWDKLESATRARLISKNYPTSLLLSGGLDSSIIGGLLLKLGADAQFYSIENGEDEEHIKACENYWNISSHRLKYSMDTEDQNNSKMLKQIYKKWNESPVDLGSVVPQYYLFDAIKKGSKTRIVISGDGADELFGGYRRINEYDSQLSDIFHELTYYHLPRLDKLSMSHTLELRNPFLNLDIVKFAISLPFEERKNKKILKDTFRGLVPDCVIDRKKLPLKNSKIVENPLDYRKKAVSLYLG